MKSPPYCPNTDCAAHLEPPDHFFERNGFYRTKSNPHAIPRFRCRECRVGFSRQTFRLNYCDNKPWLNARVFELLCCGVGLRQTARRVGMTPRNLELKARKLMRHARHFHHNMMDSFPQGSEFAFDELETFEGCRRSRPVTVPILIHQESMFVVDAQSDTLPPRGKRRRRRSQGRREHPAAAGPRRLNRSREVCRRVLQTLRTRYSNTTGLRFRSDMKRTYPALLREAFGTQFRHQQVHSRRKRDTSNPLHRINLTLARTRDLMSRLRRRSWLVSKDRRVLDLHLMAYACYRNFVEARFNGDTKTPAEMLGFATRRLSLGELLAWRQDHGSRSLRPAATPSQPPQ